MQIRHCLSAIVMLLVLGTSTLLAEFGEQLFTLAPVLGSGSEREPLAGQEFGSAAAIGDGFALVAAEEDAFHGNSAGAVWLIDVSIGQTIAALDPSDIAAEDGLGESVSIDGTLGVMSADAKNNDTGIAYLFDLATQTELRTLTAADATAGDEFGQAVGISGDLIVVGAEGADMGQGAGYIFRASTGEQLHRVTVEGEAELGNEAAISGNNFFLGGDNPAVYLFDAITGELRAKLTGDEGSGFGSSVAMDGKWGVIGSDEEGNDAGAAYLIDLDTAQSVYRFEASDKEEGDEFGDTVAIDGTTVLISATSDNDSAGSVYVFDAITGIQLAKLAPEGISSDDGFGAGIGVRNGIAVIGADGDTFSDGQASGLAYLFNVNVDELADVNDDGTVDVADLDGLSAAVAAASTDSMFDLNHDGAVNAFDRTVWIEALNHTYLGDSNLDGEFNSSDLVAVFATGEYEDAVDGNSGWADGDWNGDGDFNTSDLVAAFSAGGYDVGARAATAAVPEPTSILLMLVGCVFVCRRR